MHQITVWMRAPYLSLLTTQYKIHICILPFESRLQWLEISSGPLDIIGYLVEEVLKVWHQFWLIMSDLHPQGFHCRSTAVQNIKMHVMLAIWKNTSIYIVNLTYILACIRSIFRSRKSSESLGVYGVPIRSPPMTANWYRLIYFCNF